MLLPRCFAAAPLLLPPLPVEEEEEARRAAAPVGAGARSNPASTAVLLLTPALVDAAEVSACAWLDADSRR